MSHADRPYVTRPLAGVDQALGEGRARQPAELLDQLRERLERLEPNHPSASPGPADEAAVPEESTQASRPDRPSLRKDGSDESGDDQPVDQGAGEPPPDRQAGRGPVGADGAGNDLADDGPYADGQYGHGQYDHAGTGLAAKGEPYRPWFADEPGTPWFVEPGIVE